MDDTLTIADVQAIGTHNSYHVAPDDILDPSFDYTQPTLDAQADLGVRAFELDVHLTDDGVFEVFHLPVLDPEATCPTLGECLSVLWTWSEAHPCHSPFTVWIEPKDDLDASVAGLVALDGHLTELDDAITAVWPRERLLEPDDVRGDHATLAEGVAAGWPSLAETRGDLLLALLDSGAHRSEYLAGAPSLEGRVLFVDSDSPDDAFAGTFKIDDAGGDAAAVEEAVAGNFLVTSNVDAADADDTANAARLAAALDAGPHNFASDRLTPADGSAYAVDLPGGSPRCHPGRVADGCGPEVIEPADL